MFCLFEIGFNLGEWVRYLSAGSSWGCEDGLWRPGPRIRFKYNSVETEEMTIDLSLFWPDYDIMELLMPETKI